MPPLLPAAPQASFAARWFVSGIARIGSEDFVTIKSRDLSKQFSLYGNREAVDGVELASVTWSDSVGKSTVVLRKGTETAKLESNEAELHAAAPPAAKPPARNPPAECHAGGPNPVCRLVFRQCRCLRVSPTPRCSSRVMEGPRRFTAAPR